MARQERPFIIRNTKTGAEFEVATLEKFERVYGDNPEWYIATGPNRQTNRQLGERASAEQEDAGGGDVENELEEESDVSDLDVSHPLDLSVMSRIEGESEST
jgi:hypothetical protein